jgi:hypothetical protein
MNPELFDRGEKIYILARELRRVAISRQLTDADTITALQTALGGELAAALQRNPTWSPDQIRGLATHILNEAMKNNTPVGDALSATAKAAGLIIGNVVAERPGVSAEELIKFIQNAVAEFAQEAIKYRASPNK